METNLDEEQLYYMRSQHSLINDNRSKHLIRLIDKALLLRREIEALDEEIEQWKRSNYVRERIN